MYFQQSSDLDGSSCIFQWKLHLKFTLVSRCCCCSVKAGKNMKIRFDYDCDRKQNLKNNNKKKTKTKSHLETTEMNLDSWALNQIHFSYVTNNSVRIWLDEHAHHSEICGRDVSLALVILFLHYFAHTHTHTLNDGRPHVMPSSTAIIHAPLN